MPEFVSNTIQAHVARLDTNKNEYQYLVLKRSSNSYMYPSMWQTITGRIESGESAVDTAIRELKEEAGLNYLKIWAIPYITKFYNFRNDTVSFSPVFGFLVDFADQISLSEEHEEYDWLNYMPAHDRLMLPSHKEGLKIFRDYILFESDNGIYRLGL